MFAAYAALAILLALVLGASGYGTITRQPPIVANFERANVPLSWYPTLGTLKIAGAIGLLVGLGVAAIGVIAGFALAIYFAGAVSMHVRAGDRTLAPPVLLGLLSLLAAILRIASA